MLAAAEGHRIRVLIADDHEVVRLGIGRLLENRPKTVKSHLSHIFRAIGVKDRFEAAMWARRHGLVDDPTDQSRNTS
jgi:DNA-binding NarL/FixJ family response regulator